MEAQTKDVESSILDKLSSLPEPSSNCCIYKVPEHIREVNNECYRPLIISVGPIHYNNPSLKSSLKFKLQHLKCFLELATRTNNGNQAYSLGQYIDIVKQWEKEARSYYEEKTCLTSKEFVEMMMVDAAFIIYFFMCFGNTESTRFPLRKIPILEKNTWKVKVLQDIFIEDNQLPFFVLNNLYDVAFGATYPHISFKDLTCHFIGNSALTGNKVAITILGREKVKTVDINHLVDFLRVCCLPSKLRGYLRESVTGFILPPNAETLKASGVKFKASENKNLLDIEFSDGVLKIPRLAIEDITEGFLRNIIFYEQSHLYYKSSYFVDYVFFLDALIDTREDVHILVQHGIIEHWLGSDAEVATIINRLTKYIMIGPNFYYADISQKLKGHANTRMNKWKAVLKKNYFSHPWSTISVLYLVILLLLTVLQVYTGFK